VGAGEIKIKANSAFKISLSWGLALAELGNKTQDNFSYCVIWLFSMLAK
jgi:hypothetical protein